MMDFLSKIAVPIIILFAGVFLRGNRVFINCVVGYRTKFSMSSEEMWFFAQKLAGKCLIFVASIQIIIVGLLWVLNILDRINDDILYGTEIGTMLGAIFWIEYKLRQEYKKKEYDKNNIERR